MTNSRKYLFINGKRAGRTVFFAKILYDFDCLTPGSLTVLVASRFQAKKLARWIANRVLHSHSLRIASAWQRDLWQTGWTIDRRGSRPRLDAVE